MSIAETAHLVTQLDLRDGLSSGLATARRNVTAFGRQVDADVARIGKGVGQVGRGLARVGVIAGGAVAVGLGAAAKAAIDYEDAFAGVRKTVQATPAELDAMSRRFRDLATEIPISAVEFARLGEAAGALGVRKQDITEFTRVTALMGVTTNLSSDAAADAFGRIGTILGLTGKQYTQLADTIVNLGNKGASTESEITEIMKRFAAEGKAAGLATTEIAGLGSAVASLGFAPERGGTALARVFANMGTNISLANAKGQEFSRLTGRSIRELQRDLDQGRGLDVFMDVLKAIRGMTPTEANRALRALGVTNQSDRTIFRTMSQQLPFINDQLKTAADSTGALSQEAEKRFDTVKSKFQLLRNNIVEAGITIGEGFAPALGRSAKRLSAWIRANKDELKGMGQEIGRAIDGIDWGKLADGAKAFLGFLHQAWDVLKAIPPEVIALGAGLVGLNKLSGGLLGAGVGNIVGGLAGAATRGVAAKLPGVGSVFAQPVFVTNWPAGGLGGVAGEAGAVGGGRGGMLKTLGKGLLGLGIGLGAQVLGDQIGGDLGKATSSLGAVAGAFVAGGPVLGALVAVTTALTTISDELGTIGEYQTSNREKAEQVAGNITDAGRNLANMSRLIAENRGDLLRWAALNTTSAGEIGLGMMNSSDALVKGLTKGNQGSAIATLVEAQRQAQAAGWSEVAEHIGQNLEAARRWMPKPEAFGAAVLKGSMAGTAAGIGKGERAKARKDDRDLTKVMDHLRQVDSHKGNERLFGRTSDRLARQVRDALRATGKDRDSIIRSTIGDLKREQKRALESGHTKLARNLGRDITVLRSTLGRKQDTANTRLSTIANKDPKVSVTVPVTTTVSVRDVVQKSTTYSRYGYSAV